MGRKRSVWVRIEAVMLTTTVSFPNDRDFSREIPEKLPRADLYIAALPRSGATMLANLLSCPPNRWILVEPGLHHPRPSSGLPIQISRFLAASGADPAGRAAATLTSRRQILDQLADCLPRLEAWGIKEVGPEHDTAITALRPRKTVILVRDVRDVLLSFLEHQNRLLGCHWAHLSHLEYLSDCCTALAALCERDDPNTRICRYEDLVSSPNERNALADWLSWPLDGDIDRNLDLYYREYEIARHCGEVSINSVGRYSREQPSINATLVRQLGMLYDDFNGKFGYPDSWGHDKAH